MLLDRNTFLKLKKAGYAEMRAFCERLYRQGFEDGANADVDPNIKYIAVKDGTEYICGNCGAKLELEEMNDSETTWVDYQPKVRETDCGVIID